MGVNQLVFELLLEAFNARIKGVKNYAGLVI